MENAVSNMTNFSSKEEYYDHMVTSGSVAGILSNFIDSSNSSSASNGPLPLPMFYSLPYKIIGCIFVSIIFIVGFTGNLMVIIVVSRTRTMLTPTNCYLVSLAVADCILLFTAALPTVFDFYLIIGQWILGYIGCSVVIFLQYLGINASSLSITAFTVERYIAICHPMKAQTVCTVSRAKRIITCLWLFGILYCAPWLALTKIIQVPLSDGSEISRCTHKLARKNLSYLLIYMTDLILFYVIPLIVTGVLYGLIGWVLFKSAVPSTPGKAAPNDIRKFTSQSRIQVVKMLVVVVGMFATLWMPYRIWVVYNSFQPAGKRFTDLWFALFCRIMVYMNSAINPILYNAMSVKFRRAFKKLLLCRKARRDVKPCIYSEVAPDVQSRKRQSVSCTNGSDSKRHNPSGTRTSRVFVSRNVGSANRSKTELISIL